MKKAAIQEGIEKIKQGISNGDNGPSADKVVFNEKKQKQMQDKLTQKFEQAFL